MARSRSGATSIGNLLFLTGCLVVLGATFGAGVITGRYWSRAPGPAVTARAATADPASTPVAAPTPSVPAVTPGTGESAGKTPPGGSKITFYQELKAPLTPSASPPTVPSAPPTSRPRPTKQASSDVALPPRTEAPPTGSRAPASAAPASAAPAPAAPAPAAPAPAASTAAATSAPATSGGPRYTVQVGAYKARPPAEALRASLAAAGHDAYVVETEGTGGARYRVRVGSFATRQAAVDAAARLGGDGYVTTR
jgi:cell division protein FtsN